MFNAQTFVGCIYDQLEQRGFGKKRADEIVDNFNGLRAGFEQAGMSKSDAAVKAMDSVFARIIEENAEKQKRLFKDIAVLADMKERVSQARDVSVSAFAGDGLGDGSRYAMAAVSQIADDPRFKGLSLLSRREATFGQFKAILADVFDKMGKGAFGVQRGVEHLPDLVREMFGESTGNAAARDAAHAFDKVDRVAVGLFNDAGGSLRRLDRYVPQPNNSVGKMVTAGEEQFVKDMTQWADWDRMRWPDGSPITDTQRFNPETGKWDGVNNREEWLRRYYQTVTLNGANKINADAMQGQGRAVGNMLDVHRQLHLKDADSWLAAHEKYGDGNVYDVLMEHVSDMADKISLVDTFGPNPSMTQKTIHALVRKEAAKDGPQALAQAEAVLKNKFDPMFETVTGRNPLDVDNPIAAGMIGTSNLLTAAQLGSAVIPAFFGDIFTTSMVRALNKQSIFGWLDTYVKALVGSADVQRHAATAGFIADHVVQSTYAQTRFSGVTTYGPAVTRRVADTVLRASGMNLHTDGLRLANKMEFMASLARDMEKSMDQLPYSGVFERYGITPADWDKFRSSVTPYSPQENVHFLQPIDILKSGIPEREAQALYQKFQGMMYAEARHMVLDSTVEAAVTMRGTERPDTVRGAMLYSFGMYKNFAVTYAMTVGRLALSNPDKKGRLAWLTGMTAGMTLVGALAVQMREIAKGNDPLPVDSPKFLAQAVLAGGGFSILGDFIAGGLDKGATGAAQIVGGPLAGLAGDVLGLTFAGMAEVTGDPGYQKTPAGARAVEFLRRNTPGANLWPLRAAVQRGIFDNLQEIADPRAYAHWQRQANKRAKDYGGDSGTWWGRGDVMPTRAPNIGSAMR